MFHAHIHFYADDTVIYCSVPSHKDCSFAVCFLLVHHRLNKLKVVLLGVYTLCTKAESLLQCPGLGINPRKIPQNM